MCPHEEPVIVFHLACVRRGKCRYCLIELRGPTGVPGDSRRIAGSSMPFGEHFATETGLGKQRPPVELGRMQCRFVIRELPDQVVVSAKSGVAEECVG